MKCSLARLFIVVALIPVLAFAQAQPQKRADTKTNKSQNDTIKICRNLAIPEGYVIVELQNSTACPDGAYLLKKEDVTTKVVDQKDLPFPAAAAARPRKVSGQGLEAVNNPPGAYLNEPELKTAGGISLEMPSSVKSKYLSPASPDTTVKEEVGNGDVLRIDTNLVTVPVSVMDRQGKFIPGLSREQFKVFENDVEQPIAHFENTEKPFTVALMLDTSGSTYFHLSEIQEAAITFAKQLRPQDRVLVVTFDRLIMLLTEATSDQKVVTEVIQRNVVSGFSTRVYDAIQVVIKQRLDKISGRKAIVLFTDGVDTSSYNATYKSTMRDVDERDILIYPVEYDTSNFLTSNQTTLTTVTTRSNLPGASSQVTHTGPTSTIGIAGSFTPDYKLADQFLHELADKSGARLYQANDKIQLKTAFAAIAEELRSQYSIGYYPQMTLQDGERRLIKVRVEQVNVAVRARESYTQRK
jgi:Ca-activated chloride channel homolog